MSDLSARRFLLVNFCVPGHFQHGFTLPYLHHALRGAGGDCVKVRLGLPRDGSLVEDGVVSLAPPDAERVDAFIADWKPTHVLFSREVGRAVVHGLRARWPSLRLAWLRDYARHGLIDLVVDAPTSLSAWGGLALDEALIFRDPSADFAEIPLGRLAEENVPVPVLLVGRPCTYARNLARLEEFRGLELQGCRATGCSFCLIDQQAYDVSDPAAALARLLGQAVKTCDFRGGRPRFKLLGEVTSWRTEALVAMIATENVPPADFLVDARVATIIANAESLQKSLASLRGTGHRLVVASIGVENFSTQELRRFNKGIECHEVLDAIAILVRLRREYGDVFDWESLGSLSTILYTPWTTLGDLELNLRIVRALGIDEVFGKLLRSRLRLTIDMPLYRLAAEDGALVDSYDDAWCDTAHINAYAPEAPWRFLDAQVERASPVLLRLGGGQEHLADDLSRAVRAWRHGALSPSVSDVDAALLLLESAKESGISGDAGEWLARTPLASLRTSFAVTPSPLDFIKQAFMDTGLKPVFKVEGVSPDELASVRADVRRRFAGPLSFAVQPRFGRADFCLYFGPRSEQVEAAARWTAARSEAVEERRVEESVRRIGDLFGYPPCCVETFIRTSAFEKQFGEWAVLGQRLACPGPVDDRIMLMLFGLDLYRPCSLGCAESLARALVVLERVSSAGGSAARALVETHLGDVVFMLPERPGDVGVLHPLGAESDEFRYSTAWVSGNDARIRHLVEGDTISARGAQVEVSKDERVSYTFVAEAALFSAKIVHGDRALWRGLFEARASAADTKPAERDDGLATRISAAVAPFAQRLAARLGVRVLEVRARVLGAELVFECPDGLVRCHITRAAEGEPAFVRGKRFAMGYASGSKLDTSGKAAAFSALFKLIDARA